MGSAPEPPYSPDLTPSDYHLFGSLEEHTRGQHYENEAIQQTAHMAVKYFNGLLPQWQIQACVALGEIPGSFWGFHTTGMGHLQ
jgi:hypothetical protein